jgi:uncharacterized cupin superfamily protein
MPTIFKPDAMEFGLGPFNKPPFGLLTAIPNLCKQVESKNLIFDVRKLPSGEYSFPYHYHRNAEEVMIIISGSMTVRSVSGFQILGPGEIVYFETGESGAHQFYNHTDEPCTYLDVKTIYGMDMVVYPDSGKVMISQYNEIYDKKNGQVNYFKDEENVAEKWGTTRK